MQFFSWKYNIKMLVSKFKVTFQDNVMRLHAYVSAASNSGNFVQIVRGWSISWGFDTNKIKL